MKILLVFDVKNWALDREAAAIIKYNPEYNIEKMEATRFEKNYFKTYTLVHSMNWYILHRYCKEVSGGIRSHNYELLHNELANRVFPKFKALMTCSKRVHDKVKNKNTNVIYAPQGVMQDKFIFSKRKKRDKMVMGFVGQKTFGGFPGSKLVDIKGFHFVLLPLIERLKKYKNIEFKVCDNNYRNALPFDTMPSFYQDIDCLLSTSIEEGTPNSILEAMSSGRTVLATNTGIAPEVINNFENRFIVDRYYNQEQANITIQQFENTIIYLNNNRELLDIWGEQNRKTIEDNWTWKQRAKHFIELFNLYK